MSHQRKWLMTSAILVALIPILYGAALMYFLVTLRYEPYVVQPTTFIESPTTWLAARGVSYDTIWRIPEFATLGCVLIGVLAIFAGAWKRFYGLVFAGAFCAASGLMVQLYYMIATF